MTEHTAFWARNTAANAATIALALFFGLILLSGGASRADAQSQLVVREASIAATVLFMALPMERNFAPLRIPLILIASLFACIALQLMPLPPMIWRTVVPIDLLRTIASLAAPDAWRPISVSPDLTLNSLMALLPAIATLVGLSTLPEPRRALIVHCIIVGALVSAIVSIGQLAGGPTSALYLYRITNQEAAVGLFANRNHQALFIALALPAVMVWASAQMRTAREQNVRRLIAFLLLVFFMIMIVATGSRAGLLLAVVGAVGGWLIVRNRRQRFPLRLSRRMRLAALGGGGIAAVLLVVVLIAASRAQALQRIFDTTGAGGDIDLRLSNLPQVLELVRLGLPFGFGFGTFDPIFRIVEPSHDLQRTYFNHAHNDALELIVTGGLPAFALAMAFFCWWAFRSWDLWKSPSPNTGAVDRGRLGSLVIFLVAVASLVDYPLRTPTIMTVMVVACVWLAQSRGSRAADQGDFTRSDRASMAHTSRI